MTTLATDRARTIAGLALALAGLAGCAVQTVDGTRTASLEVTGTRSLDIATRNGSIQAMEAEGSAIEVTATIRARSQERLDAFEIDVREADGRVSVRAVPPGGRWRSGEGCSFEVTAPGADGIRAETSNGAITIVGLSGAAELDTSNGSVTVRHHVGPIHAASSNGNISIGAARGGEFRATTSNGNITLEADEVASFDLGTSNGSIEVRVPSSFAGRVAMATSNGRIRYLGFPGVRELRDYAINREHEAEVQFGEGGQSCRAHTSNGNITLRAD